MGMCGETHHYCSFKVRKPKTVHKLAMLPYIDDCIFGVPCYNNGDSYIVFVIAKVGYKEKLKECIYNVIKGYKKHGKKKEK